ncbi:MAG: hypothetical protein ACR2KE_02570 [Candidatus Nanopelagicales bacterium]
MTRRAWAALAIALVSCLALGAILGVMWERLAPRVELFVAADGKAYPQTFQPEGYMTDDGIAAALCLVGGLIVGVLTVVVLRRVRSDRDHALRASLLVAVPLGVVGAAAMWFVGTRLGGFDLAQALAQYSDGDTLSAPLRLRMPGVLVLWPAMSALVVFAVALGAWVRDRSES